MTCRRLQQILQDQEQDLQSLANEEEKELGVIQRQAQEKLRRTSRREGKRGAGEGDQQAAEPRRHQRGCDEQGILLLRGTHEEDGARSS